MLFNFCYLAKIEELMLNVIKNEAQKNKMTLTDEIIEVTKNWYTATNLISGLKGDDTK